MFAVEEVARFTRHARPERDNPKEAHLDRVAGERLVVSKVWRRGGPICDPAQKVKEC
jgi:hypothetical protein